MSPAPRPPRARPPTAPTSFMPHSDAAWRGGARPEEAEGADRHPLFPGGGEMAARCRALEWAATPLGHVEAWPASLRTAAVLVVAAGFPQVLLWGPELVQLYNDGYRALMGAKHPNGLGQPTRACWPEVWHLNAPVYARVWAGETVMLEDALFPITRSGVLEDAWFTLGYSPIWDVTGDATHASDATVVGVLVTLIETTAQVRGRAAQGERERLHAALEVERSRLAEVFRQAPAFLAVLRGPAHVFDLANDAYYQLVGHREVVGKPVLEALPEIEGQGFVELLDGVLQTGQPFLGREVPILLARTPGAPPEERFVDLTYLPLVEAGGTRAGVIAHGSDVTAQVEARREVERLLGESERARADAAAAHTEADAERRQLALVLDRLPVGVVVVDANAAVVHLNPACDAVLGTSLRPVARLEDYATYGGGLHADGRPYAPEDYPIARALLAGEVVRQELTRYRRGDGRIVMVSISAAPVHGPDGRIAYAVAAIEDVHALEAARAEAQTANRAKGEFLAVMSHELRTPLNAIGGYAELMEMGIRGPVTDQQREDLGRIQRSQRHLLGLVNEVLNYAKLETGTVRYDVADVPVRGALAEAEALIAPQARAKGLVLGAPDCAEDLVVLADPEKLRQVLVNLLSNAVKFTTARGDEPGRITVTCAADGARVQIAVADTGIGIAADKLDAIFEPFVQVRADLTRMAEGTGLGLAISRDLAHGMGGELTVWSRPGAGSTFTLALPQSHTPGV